MSEEQKAKLSAIRKGKPRSPEASAKAAESNRGKKRTSETRARIGSIHKGKVVSDETRTKQSSAAHHRWEMISDEQKAKKINALRKSTEAITDSMFEEVIAQELDSQGTKYERQKTIGWYKVDFYVPETNTVIEAQGCWWHGCEECGYNDMQHREKREKDAKRYEYLHRKGYSLTLIWEHERKYSLREMRRKTS